MGKGEKENGRKTQNTYTMRLSSRDMSAIGLFGAGGFLAGAVYKLFETVVEKRLGSPLSIEVEALPQVDRGLMVLLHQLEKDFQDNDPVAFIRAVDHIDRLLHLRQTLDRVQPTIQDRVYAFSLFKVAEENLQRLVRAIEHTMPPRSVIEGQNLIRRVMDSLETHLDTIMLLTRDQAIIAPTE